MKKSEEEWKKEDWEQHNESRCGKKHQIRTEHAGNRSRGAYRRDSGIGICEHLGETSDAAAQ